MLDNVVKAMQYSRLRDIMSKYSKDVKRDLGLKTQHDIDKRARAIIYSQK